MGGGDVVDAEAGAAGLGERAFDSSSSSSSSIVPSIVNGVLMPELVASVAEKRLSRAFNDGDIGGL